MNIQPGKGFLASTTGLGARDWIRARQSVSDKGLNNGSVRYPRPGERYAGQVVMVTDSHVIQRVGRNSAVAHELDRVTNGAELGQALRAMKPGVTAPILLFRYEGDRGVAEPAALKSAQVAEVRRLAEAWAKDALTSEPAREEFLRRMRDFTADLADKRLPHFGSPLARFARHLADDQQAGGTPHPLARIEGRLAGFNEAKGDSGAAVPLNVGSLRTLDRTVDRPALDPLVTATALLWARLDVDDYRKLPTEAERQKAVAALAGNTSAKYQEAVRVVAPELAAVLASQPVRQEQAALALVTATRHNLAGLTAGVQQAATPEVRQDFRRGLER